MNSTSYNQGFTHDTSKSYQNDQGIDSSLCGQNLRLKFTRKVLSIVAFQLFFTSIVTCLAMNSLKWYALCHLLFFPALFLAVVSAVWLHLSRSISIPHPQPLPCKPLKTTFSSPSSPLEKPFASQSNAQTWPKTSCSRPF